MRCRPRALLTLTLTLVTTAHAVAQSPHWPSFRGPHASGVADGHPTPVAWDVEKSENVLWKTPIPGLGHSSPIVWGDRLFVTTALTGKKKAELKVGLYGDIDPVDDSTEHSWRLYSLSWVEWGILYLL